MHTSNHTNTHTVCIHMFMLLFFANTDIHTFYRKLFLCVYIYIQYTHTNMHTKITYIILYICAFIHRVHMSSHCQGFNVLFNSWPGLSASSSSRREFLHGALPRWFHCRSRAIAAVSAAVPVINSLGILQKLRSLEPSLFSAGEPVRDQTPASCTKIQKPMSRAFSRPVSL